MAARCRKTHHIALEYIREPAHRYVFLTLQHSVGYCSTADKWRVAQRCHLLPNMARKGIDLNRAIPDTSYNRLLRHRYVSRIEFSAATGPRRRSAAVPIRPESWVDRPHRGHRDADASDPYRSRAPNQRLRIV